MPVTMGGCVTHEMTTVDGTRWGQRRRDEGTYRLSRRAKCQVPSAATGREQGRGCWATTTCLFRALNSILRSFIRSSTCSSRDIIREVSSAGAGLVGRCARSRWGRHGPARVGDVSPTKKAWLRRSVGPGLRQLSRGAAVVVFACRLVGTRIGRCRVHVALCCADGLRPVPYVRVRLCTRVCGCACAHGWVEVGWGGGGTLARSWQRSMMVSRAFSCSWWNTYLHANSHPTAIGQECGERHAGIRWPRKQPFDTTRSSGSDAR